MFWLLTGLLLTAAWLTGCALWVEDYHGWENLLYLAPFEQAMVVAGILAPLGFLWSLVGLIFLSNRLAALKALLGDRRTPAESPASSVASPAAPRLEAVASKAPSLEAVSREIAPRLQATPSTPAPLKSVETEAAPRLSIVPETLETKAPPLKAPEPLLTVVQPPAEARDAVTSIAQEVAKALGRIQTPQEAPTASQSARAAFEAKVKQVSRDLNAISMDLSAILCRKNHRDDALKAFNKGEREVFHELLRKHFATSDRKDVMRRLVQSDSVSLLHSFAIKFGSLLDEAQKLDPAGLEEKMLEESSLGGLYAEVQRLTAEPRGSAA